MNDSYQKTFILTLFIILVFVGLFSFPGDDGLRHVGLAFGNFKTWGEVYPFSIFDEFKDYNPWFGYDFCLSLIANILKHFPVSLLTLKFVLTKIIGFLFSLAFFYLVLERSGILKKIIDRQSFLLVLIVLNAFLIFTFSRFIIARPFAFGTFFLLYSAHRKGFIRGIVSSSVLTFFYPYLSWFYIVPVVFAHIIRGDKKFAFGGITFLICFLMIQPASFWGFQIELFMSDLVRKTIEIKISEFDLTLRHWTFYLYLVGWIIFFPSLSEKASRLNYLNLLLLMYMFPALKYFRYFIDLILPLLFVNYANDIFKILIEPYRKLTLSWQTIIQSRVEKLKYVVISQIFRKRKIASLEKSKVEVNLKPYIAISYLFVLFLGVHLNLSQLGELGQLRDVITPLPENSLVLTSFNLQYQTLYLRPDLHLIPSCEMGFANKYVAEDYKKYFNEGIVRSLSMKTGSEYFLEGKDFFIDPREGKFLRLLKKSGKYKLWKIVTKG